MDISVLFEDAHIIVVLKPPMLVCESTAKKDGLADLLAERTGGYIGTVHRLDRGVGGVMVYANNRHAAAALSAAVQEHRLTKEYLAVIHGVPAADTDTLRDLLFHDRRQNKTFAVTRERAGVKEAILEYVLQKSEEIPPYGTLSLVRVKLHTGRTHQIRVQFSTRGHALLGDGKYGASGDRCPIALFSHTLCFPHPRDGRQLTFTKTPDGEIWNRLIL